MVTGSKLQPGARLRLCSSVMEMRGQPNMLILAVSRMVLGEALLKWVPFLFQIISLNENVNIQWIGEICMLSQKRSRCGRRLSHLSKLLELLLKLLNSQEIRVLSDCSFIQQLKLHLLSGRYHWWRPTASSKCLILTFFFFPPAFWIWIRTSKRRPILRPMGW